jgi:hypothetical protein
MSEPELREPYAAHVKEAREELGKLHTQRATMLGQVYQVEQSIAFLERHVKSIEDIERKAAGDGKL